jgi:hypothetical protein
MHWPDPTTEEPTPQTLMEWADEGAIVLGLADTGTRE